MELPAGRDVPLFQCEFECEQEGRDRSLLLPATHTLHYFCGSKWSKFELFGRGLETIIKGNGIENTVTSKFSK